MQILSLRKRTPWLIIIVATLICLIVLNLAFIWVNSSKESKASDGDSKRIAQKVAEKAVKDYDKLGKVQKEKKIEKINEKIRETAHFVEFIPLGLLIFLLMFTLFAPTDKKTLVYFLTVSLVTLGLCALFALGDEYHQKFVEGRSFQKEDILTDTLGSCLGMCISLLSVVFYYIKKKISATK